MIQHIKISLMMLLCFMAVLCCGITARAHEQDQAPRSVNIVERPDNEFLILGLEINGYFRSAGIEAYLPDEASPDDVLIPLGALSKALSISIEVDPAEGTAEGFFLEEDQIFQLDMVSGQVISASERFEVQKNDAEAHYDDIYVKASVLEKWFALDIDLETSSLTLYVDSGSTFPFEEAEERKQRANRLLTTSRKNDFDPKEAYLLPYGLYSPPSLVLQQSLLATSTVAQNTLQSTSNIQAGFDFLKFGGNLNLSYAADNQDRKEITDARLTFSRSDPTQQIFGKFKTGRVDIGDIDFTPVPLLVGAQRGAGVRISTEADFGFRFSQQLGNILIDGDAPVDWDIELYRNGQFIDFQTVGSNARFSFADVTLINGFNRFQILLFGPEGQKRTFTRDVFSGPNMLSEGQVRYNFAAGLPQSDFLPLAEQRRDDTTIGASGELFYGVNNFLTLGGSFYSGPINDERASSAGLSAAASFLGFNAQLQGLYANQQRTAIQAAVRRQFLGVNTALTHTIFNEFDPDDQDLESSTEISFSRNFGKLNVTLIGEKQKFLEEEERTIIENILSSELFGIKFTNELTKTISDNQQIDDLEGEISAFHEIFDVRIRSSLAYDLDPEAQDTFRSFRINAQKKFTDRNAVRFASNYDFPSETLSADVRYSRQFGAVTIDFDVGATTDETYTTGVTLRTSLQPRKSKYNFVSPRIGTLATLGVRAFIDENGNQIYDDGEKTIEDILFKTSRGEAVAVSEDDGVAWMYGLAETPTRIYVSQKDIPSIYLVPAKKGVDLIPRRGAKSVVDFPFTQLGEIDGFVLDTASGEPLRNVPIKVINVATGEEIEQTTSEYDGFYIFSALPLGQYKVIASQSWFDEENSDTDAKTVKLGVEEPNLYNINLSVDAFIEEAQMQKTDETLARDTVQ